MIPGSGGWGAQDAGSTPGQGDSALGAGDIGPLASWRGPLTNSTDVTWAQGRNEEFQALLGCHQLSSTSFRSMLSCFLLCINTI